MSRNDVFIGHLSEVPLFSALSRKELGLVARRAEDVRVDSGRVLVSEGSSGSEFFVILSGTAKVSRRGRKVATLGPGAAFGELALLDKGPRTATITSLTPMTVLVMTPREFATALDRIPGLATKIMSGLAKRIREMDIKLTG